MTQPGNALKAKLMTWPANLSKELSFGETAKGGSLKGADPELGHSY